MDADGELDSEEEDEDFDERAAAAAADAEEAEEEAEDEMDEEESPVRSLPDRTRICEALNPAGADAGKAAEGVSGAWRSCRAPPRTDVGFRAPRYRRICASHADDRVTAREWACDDPSAMPLGLCWAGKAPLCAL